MLHYNFVISYDIASPLFRNEIVLLKTDMILYFNKADELFSTNNIATKSRPHNK